MSDVVRMTAENERNRKLCMQMANQAYMDLLIAGRTERKEELLAKLDEAVLERALRKLIERKHEMVKLLEERAALLAQM